MCGFANFLRGQATLQFCSEQQVVIGMDYHLVFQSDIIWDPRSLGDNANHSHLSVLAGSAVSNGRKGLSP